MFTHFLVWRWSGTYFISLGFFIPVPILISSIRDVYNINHFICTKQKKLKKKKINKKTKTSCIDWKLRQNVFIDTGNL